MQTSGTQSTGSTGGSYDTEAMRERASASIDRASSGAHQTVDRLASQAQAARERLMASGEEWAQQGQQYMEQTRDMVRANPLAAVGIAVAAGILLSKLTSRR